MIGEGKEDIRNIVKELKKDGFTIIYITNVIDEIFLADRVILLEKGKIIKEFRTEDILDNVDFLKNHEISIPKAVEIKNRLESKGINIDLEELI